MLVAALLLALVACVAPVAAWGSPAREWSGARGGVDAAAWRWPLHGEVVTPFRAGSNPFAPGQHRGIDIAAAAGAVVRSACPGRVRFAGRLPARGRVVSVVCGPLVATYLELGAITVRRGDAVAAGDRIGSVAASHLQLGARRSGEPNGYVDPLALLRPGDGPPPLGAAPRSVRPPPADRPLAPSRATPATAPAAPVEQPARVPLAAWLGLGLLAAGTPVGAVLKHRRAGGVARRAAHRSPASEAR